MSDREVNRRTVLRTLAAGSALGTVGYTGSAAASDHGQPPVVGEEPAGPQQITVDVEVVDRNGDPVADEPVVLEDRGGTPDNRRATTGPSGRIRFVEGVGPAPCNTQTVKLPERGQSKSLGCNNGGAELQHTFEVDAGNGGDGLGPQEIAVDVTVLDDDGDPLANEPVVLKDRSGTPDNRRAETDSSGHVQFIEGVGPAPCNTQTVELPDRGKSASLGCNNGGARLEHTFELGASSDRNDGIGDQEIAVDVTVLDGNDEPVADEPVLLKDRGGTPDNRTARTDANGVVRFVEDVGPPPCNTQTVELPERGQSKSLGCNNGGARIEHTFRVGNGGPADRTPVVGEEPAGSREITVDLTVLDQNGDPVADEPVALLDRGGTPDNRIGRTGPDGTLRFVEGVGSPPCNTQYLVLLRASHFERLGCHNGGATVTRTIRVRNRSE